MLAICHTYYSLQAGVRSPADWVRVAAERGYTKLAIADSNNLHGAVHFYRAAVSAGIEPVIGATLQWASDAECIVLVTSAEGYRQLCRLLTARHLLEVFTLEEAVSGGVTDLLFLARSPGVLQMLAGVVPAGNLYALPRYAPALRAGGALWEMLPISVPTAPVPESWFIEKDDRETFAYLTDLRRLSGSSEICPDAVPGMVLPEFEVWRRCYSDTGVVGDMRAL